MATSPKGTDRRVEKTRQILRQAFLQVVREKSLTTITVQDIVERANVSRGTFYAHYADKYALVETLVREEFQRVLKILPAVSEWNRETLRRLIQIVFEYFKMMDEGHHRSRELAPYLDQVTHDELNTLILTWLKQRKTPPIQGHISLETMSQTMSWAIFGAAVQWSRTPSIVTSEQAAYDISRMILEGAASLIADLAPEE